RGVHARVIRELLEPGARRAGPRRITARRDELAEEPAPDDLAVVRAFGSATEPGKGIGPRDRPASACAGEDEERGGERQPADERAKDETRGLSDAGGGTHAGRGVARTSGRREARTPFRARAGKTERRTALRGRCRPSGARSGARFPTALPS